MITKTQAFLIREICELQCNSLDEILISIDIGNDREEILINHGLTRKDFDKAIINSRVEFQKVIDNPENIFSLSYEGLLVSLFILMYLKDKYLDRYPNAIENMRNIISNTLIKLEKERDVQSKN